MRGPIGLTYWLMRERDDRRPQSERTERMFDGFEEHRVSTGEAEIFALTGRSGPPLLLLHGYPHNHVAWHAVAPRLRDRFFLVMPDLRGYGDSKGPPPDPSHVRYSKRAMAGEALRGFFGEVGSS